jgi:hypothetical protein
MSWTDQNLKACGDRKRYDFFVRHLLGMRPPGWNAASASTTN